MRSKRTVPIVFTGYQAVVPSVGRVIQTLSVRTPLVLAILPFLAACGGGGGSGSSGGSTGSVVITQPAPAPTPTPTPSPSPSTGTGATGVDASALPVDATAIPIVFSATDLPRRSIPYEIGVATHFAYAQKSGYDPATAARWIDDLGVTAFRDDIFWNEFAPDWDLNGSYLPKALTSFLGRTTARPMLILTNGNPAIPGTEPPIEPAARAAFAKFAQRAVAATAGRDALYEIWNEWNITAARERPMLTSTGDADDPRASRYYAALAIDTARAIKEASPNAKVVIGAGGNDEDWDWISDVVARGAAKQADGVSVHLYNHCTRADLRTATVAIQRLMRLQSRLMQANAGQAIPLYISEWGWPTGTLTCSVPDSVVATNVPQFLLHTAALPWIGGSWFYELKDSSTDLNDIESRFGLYDASGAAKAGRCGFADAAKLIRESTAMAVESVTPALTIIRIVTPRGLQVVAWSTVPGKQGRLTIGGTADYTARTLCQSATSGPSADRIVPVGEMPVVIDMPGAAKLGIAARI